MSLRYVQRFSFSTLFFLIIGLFDANAENRPGYKIDDLLQTEGIGSVTIASTANCILIEKIEAYNSAKDYSRYFALGKDRTSVYASPLNSTTIASPLRLGKELTPTWMGAVSPDGRTVAFFQYKNGKIIPIIAEIDCAHDGKLDVDIVYEIDESANHSVFLNNPVWLSEDEFALSTTSDGQIANSFELQRLSAQALPSYWRRAWAGESASVSVLRSSKQSSKAPPGGLLLKVNIRTKKIEQIATGDFIRIEAANDGDTIAAIRKAEYRTVDSDKKLEYFAPKRRSELVIRNENQTSLPCEMCDVQHDTVSWSDDGSRLVFLARMKNQSWYDSQYFQYDLDQQTLEIVDVTGYALARNKIGLSTTKPVWFRGKPLFYLRSSKTGRRDWMQWEGGNDFTNVSEGFKVSPSSIVALDQNFLVGIADHSLWRFGGNEVEPRPICEEIKDEVAPWYHRDAFEVRHLRSSNQASAAVEISRASQTLSTSNSNPQFAIVTLPAGKCTVSPYPAPDAKLVGVSFIDSVALFQEDNLNGTTLTAKRIGEKASTILSANQHLAGVKFGSAVPITYQDNLEEEFTDWLFLPPDTPFSHSKMPLIVFPYPGATYTGNSSPALQRPWLFNHLNPHLLSARGFAVLIPSMPADPYGTPSDLMEGLADQILASVDRIGDSYNVSKENMGLLGHSLGGYGVLGTLTQTDKFDVAVVSAPISNISSFYGQIDARTKVINNLGISLSGAAMAESSHFRMGSAPWNDPQRYVRNSPLFSADKIKTPLMIIHGDQDYIPIGQSEEIFVALYRQNKDVEFVRYWGEDHIITSPANIRDMWERIFIWYDRYLLAEPAPER